MYVFLDESGDLSFDFDKRGVSANFIITILIVENPKPLERAVKKVIRWMKHRYPKHRGCLHAYHEDEATRKRLLKQLSSLPFSVMVIQLNKRKVYTNLQDEKAVLYNYVANILLDRLVSSLRGKEKKVFLIAAKRETNKFLNANFQDYLCKQIQGKHDIYLEVSTLSPYEHKCLQAADLLSWSAFRMLERGDSSYIDIVKSRVSVSRLFP